MPGYVPTHEQLTQDVIRILREKLAVADTGFTRAIGEASYVMGDLGLESVALVEFCMAVAKHFKRKLPFQDLVFRDQKFQDFTVGDMVKFVESNWTPA